MIQFQAEIIPAPQTDAVRYIHRLFTAAWCKEIFQITESGPAKSVGTLLLIPWQKR